MAKELQENSYKIVTQCIFGQWVSPVAYRDTLSDVLAIPEVIPFWTIRSYFLAASIIFLPSATS